MKTVAPKNRVPCDWIGLKKREGALAAPIRFSVNFIEEPDAVGFSRSRAVMPAHMALSPNQLEARIEVYAELVKQGRPLFEDGPPEQDEDPRFRCWGCGTASPLRENGTQTMPCKAEGWIVRKIAGVQGSILRETWCPECAAMGGFGCVEEEEVEGNVRGAITL